MKKAYLFTALFMMGGVLQAMDGGEPSPDPETQCYTSKEIEDQVFNAAPSKAQQLVAHLKNRDALGTPDMNGVLLVGMPGTGKTAFTKALARKAGKSRIVIHPQEVCGENRFETDINLKHRLDDIAQDTSDALIVSDKMDEMFPDYFYTRAQLESIRQAERDNDFIDQVASWLFGKGPQEKRRYEPEEAQFCKWFDTVPFAQKLFFIGIAQERKPLPHAFKHKMLNQTYHFSANPDTKAAALLWHLAPYKSIDGSVSQELLSQRFDRYAGEWEMFEAGGFNGHDMKALADGAKRYASATPSGILTAEAMRSSFDNLYAERMRNGYYKDK